jgi:hypothetical protein
MITNHRTRGSKERKSVFAVIVFVLGCLCLALGLLGSLGHFGAAKAGEEGQEIPNPGNPYWWVQIESLKPGKPPGSGTPWADSDFAALAKWGINGVEINLVWGSIEPRRGEFDFALLDRNLALAAKAQMKVYLNFWESLWGDPQTKVVGNPAPWITAREVTSDGVTGIQPPWWDEDSRQAYFDYVARTIEHVDGKPGFGGLSASYGWLDAMWGPRPKDSHGITGYAPADIRAFYRWLPRTYGTVATFNQRWHTSYVDWGQIPAAKPGDPLFAVYQSFRHDSVIQTWDELSRLVRARTKAPLYYYWGGEISGGENGPGVLENDPDILFKAAQRYHGIVLLDDSEESGLALVFGSLARSYQVPFMEEWTPDCFNIGGWSTESGGSREETSRWLGHLALGAPFQIGSDFFIYPPPQQLDLGGVFIMYPPPPHQPGFAYTWSQYRAWHETLAQVRGQTPEQPVAVLVPTEKIASGPDLDASVGLDHEIRDFWRRNHVLPHFITDQQVAEGRLDLGQFKAVVDLGNERADLPALKAYAEKHPVLENLRQMVPLLRPYVTLDPTYELLEVVPVVDGAAVWLTLANCNGQKAYFGNISFDPQAVGLEPTAFDVKIVKSGKLVPASRTEDGKIRWRIGLPPAGFEVVRLSPGTSATK